VRRLARGPENHSDLLSSLVDKSLVIANPGEVVFAIGFSRQSASMLANSSRLLTSQPLSGHGIPPGI
jgi:hypothetical protein